MQFMDESADLNCKAFVVSPVDLIHLLTFISAFICLTVSQTATIVLVKKKTASKCCLFGLFFNPLFSLDLPYGWEQEIDEEGQIIYVE